jgi:hypothetical protein
MKKSREIAKPSKITMSCLGLLVTAVILYLYFLNMSVVQVVMRTEYMQEMNQLQTDISLLEADYIKAQHEVSTRLVQVDGYDISHEKIFVSREQARLVLGSN